MGILTLIRCIRVVIKIIINITIPINVNILRGFIGVDIITISILFVRILIGRGMGTTLSVYRRYCFHTKILFL